jgi:hypothetical protein
MTSASHMRWEKFVPGSIYIFGSPNGSWKMTGRLYSFEIYNNTN